MLVSPTFPYSKFIVSLSLRRVTLHRPILAMNNQVTNIFVIQSPYVTWTISFFTSCQLQHGIELGWLTQSHKRDLQHSGSYACRRAVFSRCCTTIATSRGYVSLSCACEIIILPAVALYSTSWRNFVGTPPQNTTTTYKLVERFRSERGREHQQLTRRRKIKRRWWLIGDYSSTIVSLTCRGNGHVLHRQHELQQNYCIYNRLKQLRLKP